MAEKRTITSLTSLLHCGQKVHRICLVGFGVCCDPLCNVATELVKITWIGAVSNVSLYLGNMTFRIVHRTYYSCLYFISHLAWHLFTF